MKVQYQTMAELARDTLLIGAKEKSPQVMSIIQNIESHHFSVRGNFLDKHYMIPSAHCIQFFSKDKKIYVRTTESEFITAYRLYELEQKLPTNFLRISHTEIINIDFIDHFSLSKNGLVRITFSDKQQTYSSRRYLKKIKEILL